MNRTDLVNLLRTGDRARILPSFNELYDQDPSSLLLLIEAFLGPDARISHYASWPLTEIALTHPERMEAHHSRFISTLRSQNSPVGIRRNLMRLYQWTDIPVDLEGALYDICMRCLHKPTEAIAIKAFASTVALRIVQRYPELANELRSELEMQYDEASAGQKNRYAKVLRSLEEITE